MLSDGMLTKYLIVGSGPGGGVVARELARAGKDVLLVEEGKSIVPNPEQSFGLHDMLFKYRNGGLTPTLGKPKVAYVEAKVLGGGSEVNSGLYHRTPDYILDQWRKDYGLQGASPSDMLPFFEDCERISGITKLPFPAPVASLALHQGATALGWNSIEVPRWFEFPYAHGHPHYYFGKRRSVSQTFLQEALDHGAKIVTDTFAWKFLRLGKWWEVELRSTSGRRYHVKTENLVISGGAIHTPTLLMRSGLTHNIGRSLQLHPTVKIIAEFDREVNKEQMGVPVHQVKEFAPEITLGCSISSPGYLGIGLLGLEAGLGTQLSRWRNMATYYASISDGSRGSVYTLPGLKEPLVSYQVSDRGISYLKKGLARLSEALFAAGAKTLYPSVSGMVPLTSPVSDQMGLNRKDLQLMTIHLFSSCPMGEDRKKVAIDSFGRVLGHRGLYVSDASMLPTAPGVNPQGTIMAFSMRNSRSWLEKV